MKTKITTLFILIYLAAFSNKCYSNDITADSLQLVEFYNTMDGPNWTITWDLMQPVETWEGINLNNDCRVSHIQLSYIDLVGTIPDLDLPKLLEFELKGVELTGPLPDFSGMPLLRELILSVTLDGFSSAIPNFSNLPELRWLTLTGFISPTDIPDFANLLELERLYITGGSFPGSVPSFSLPNLEVLKISYAGLPGVVQQLDLPNLEELVLKNNQLTGPLPNLNLPSLIEMDISENELDGSIPLFDLANLEELLLFSNNLTGEIPDFNLPKLRTLRIYSNQLIGPIPDFSNMASLRTFDAHVNQLSGPIPNFSNLPILLSITLRYNELTGEVPNFSSLPKLHTLDLSQNQLSGSIPEFNYLTELRSIKISSNQLTGDLPDFSNSPLLLGINLSHNQLTGILHNYANLHSLHLSGNQLTGTIPLFENSPELRDLFLDANQLTGEIPNFDLPELEDCWLGYNNLSGPIPEFNLPALDRFYAFGMNLTGNIPSFSGCPLLGSLGLGWNQLSGCYHPNLCNIGNASFNNNPGLPNNGHYNTFLNFCFNNDSQYGKPCDDGDPNTIGETINLDCQCGIASHLITGNVFQDFNDNCMLDTLESGIENWLIRYEGLFPHFTNTDSLGNYKIHADTGTYQITLIQPNIYWDPCFVDTIIVLNDQNDTVQLDFPVQVEYECSFMDVSIGTPFIRRCFPNTYTLRYCNEGTLPETNAYVEVSFDDFTTVDSASVAWTIQDGNTFTFPIGFVDVGECGNIQIYTYVDCDSTLLGQTHCVEAHIYPDSLCLPPNTLWDGSTIDVDAVCEGDSIQFFIQNIGENNMQAPLNYIVVEDQIIHLNGTFQLESGAVHQIPVQANGQTYRLEADQAPFHPISGTPTVTVEACSPGGNPISLGFINFFPQNDFSPFVTVSCGANIGSYDPNDKRGFPEGIGPDHIIYPDTDLEYQIQFQNTGTDTAFTVIIRDSISDNLNMETFRPGASSHNYEWQIFPDNMVEFRFYDIMLPDSNVNEAASHGFILYKIEQQPDNLPGTLIHNRAGIYFDFNDPIYTSTVTHRIEDKPSLNDTIYSAYCENPLYPMDTIISIPSDLMTYEVETTHIISILGGQNSSLDTALVEGELFNGILYSNDTTLYQTYLDENGCDSLVTINLQILTGTKFTSSSISNLFLSPNPTSGKLFLHVDLEEKLELSLQIFNQQGQKLDQAIPLALSKGQQRIPLDFSNMTPGMYFIQLTGEQVQWTQKILIYKP